jgi:hypothetical protein
MSGNRLKCPVVVVVVVVDVVVNVFTNGLVNINQYTHNINKPSHDLLNT